MRQAGNELSSDRIRHDDENSWNGLGCTLSCEGSLEGHCDKDIDLTPNEFNGIAVEAFVLLIDEGVR